MDKTFLFLFAINGFLSVALGAFAAHGLKQRLDAYLLSVFQTGVEYQFYHTFALAIVALLIPSTPSVLVKASGWTFQLGIVVFSGSLYILALTGQKYWGAITPIGGVAFLAGWVLLAVSAFSKGN